MADLVPVPFNQLVTRMVREVDRCAAVFDLPLAKCFLGDDRRDVSVSFHGKRASSPLGPAAGPHSQMAQNLVLAWLGGSRIVELKTVQVLDELEIGRPCIDMRTVGYNIEWSQELKLEQSAEEYVKGALLVEMLKRVLGERLAPGFGDTIWDMSVGYDLEGIRSPTVRRFIETMMDPAPLAARLRAAIPREHAHLADVELPKRLSDTLTLSTFHGCPPDEIERILEHLMREYRLNVIVKLNPTLLGRDEIDHLLHDVLGYESIRVPAAAFEKDTTWEQACGFIERLDRLADQLDVGFGVKLTNTLIVSHDGEFLPPAEQEKYLSGTPLHVLAMSLVGRIRRRFGVRLPISFSAGIDARNFADTVALGLVPITVCTDLLRPGGYGRQTGYYRSLTGRMEACGASDVDAFILAQAGSSGSDDLEAAILANTERYLAGLLEDDRYRLERNRKPPRKIGSTLELFDCITCDKCIPVCPNDANFALPIPKIAVDILVGRHEGGAWRCTRGGTVELSEKHQIANYADLCNDCGNCDVFCPEDGGPYVVKPRFFGSDFEFDRLRHLDGFLVRRQGDAVTVRARFGTRELSLSVEGRSARYTGDGFEVTLTLDDPEATIAGTADPGVEVDLTWAVIMDLVQRGALDESSVNWVSAAQ